MAVNHNYGRSVQITTLRGWLTRTLVAAKHFSVSVQTDFQGLIQYQMLAACGPITKINAHRIDLKAFTVVCVRMPNSCLILQDDTRNI